MKSHQEIFESVASQGITSAATADALAFFATRESCDAAASALERGEFGSWSPTTQAAAAIEIRALIDAYHS